VEDEGEADRSIGKAPSAVFAETPIGPGGREEPAEDDDSVNLGGAMR